VYHAKVHGVPDQADLERVRRGVKLDGELLRADSVRLLEREKNAWLEITLHEGKNHEVKRLLEAVGHPVSKLRRVALGPVKARGLEPGQFRHLTPDEIHALRGGGRTSLDRARRRPGPRRRRSE
jgi:23S rRNA pseudouridine2605 synthase